MQRMVLGIYTMAAYELESVTFNSLFNGSELETRGDFIKQTHLVTRCWAVTDDERAASFLYSACLILRSGTLNVQTMKIAVSATLWKCEWW